MSIYRGRFTGGVQVQPAPVLVGLGLGPQARDRGCLPIAVSIRKAHKGVGVSAVGRIAKAIANFRVPEGPAGSIN